MRSAVRAFGAVFAVAVALPPLARAESLHVFAASSLTEAFQELGVLFGEQNPGKKVDFNFAGSQILRTQIEHGAEVDVFASADRVPMEALQAVGLMGPDSVFARNRLVVVTPRESPRVRRVVDLAVPGTRIAVADRGVPVGRYTLRVLEKVDRASLGAVGLRQRIMENVVSRETSVRAVLAKVSLGEVDAGFVYATDAHMAGERVRAVEIPESLNVIAAYPIALATRSASRESAARFLALVLGEQGQRTLAGHGFAPSR